MSVRDIVEVMNFHALVRVDTARKRVSEAKRYEDELHDLIAYIVDNRIFKQEKISLILRPNRKQLNIYIGSDFGFCANLNADIKRAIRMDAAENDKILIGKKIFMDVDNVILRVGMADIDDGMSQIFSLVLDGVLAAKYSSINVIYMHYYNLSKQKVGKHTILPFVYSDKRGQAEPTFTEDFIVEGDLRQIIWNLISLYISLEVRIAIAWSWASENVERKAFTDESLDRIDEHVAEQERLVRKAKKKRDFSELIETSNRKLYSNGR